MCVCGGGGGGGVRVCGDAVLLDFWCGFTKPSGLRFLEIFR